MTKFTLSSGYAFDTAYVLNEDAVYDYIFEEIEFLRDKVKRLELELNDLRNPPTDQELNGSEFTYREWLGYHEG